MNQALISDQGMALVEAGHVPTALPMDVLYLQRKFGGMFLLASRLQAELPIRSILEGYTQFASDTVTEHANHHGV